MSAGVESVAHLARSDLSVAPVVAVAGREAQSRWQYAVTSRYKTGFASVQLYPHIPLPASPPPIFAPLPLLACLTMRFDLFYAAAGERHKVIASLATT